MSWEQLGLNISRGAYLDYIGYSTSLSNDGTIVAIGAIGDDYAGTDSGKNIKVYLDKEKSDLLAIVYGYNLSDVELSDIIF